MYHESIPRELKPQWRPESRSADPERIALTLKVPADEALCIHQAAAEKRLISATAIAAERDGEKLILEFRITLYRNGLDPFMRHVISHVKMAEFGPILPLGSTGRR